MRRSSIVFILFILLIAGIIGSSVFVQNQPAQTLRIASDSSLQAWLSAQAQAFNASNPIVNNGTTRIQIEILSASDPEVWQGRSAWTAQNHPDGWIPASSASLNYLPPNLSFSTLVPSVAQSPLVWGGFASRVQALTSAGTPLDWQAVYTAAQAGTWSALAQPSNWGNVNLAISSPSTSMAGYGALLSAIADYQQSPSLNRSQLATLEFSTWFSPLRDALTAQRPSPQPALEMANRGAGWAAIALLPEYEWLTHYDALSKQEALIFSYPQYGFNLDYPVAVWGNASAVQRQGVQAFSTFLLSASAQDALSAYALRTAEGQLGTSARFAAAFNAGIQADLPANQTLQTPDRSAAEQVVRLLN